MSQGSQQSPKIAVFPISKPDGSVVVFIEQPMHSKYPAAVLTDAKDKLIAVDISVCLPGDATVMRLNDLSSAQQQRIQQLRE